MYYRYHSGGWNLAERSICRSNPNVEGRCLAASQYKPRICIDQSGATSFFLTRESRVVLGVAQRIYQRHLLSFAARRFKKPRAGDDDRE
jgi:hypothetical protein